MIYVSSNCIYNIRCTSRRRWDPYFDKFLYKCKFNCCPGVLESHMASCGVRDNVMDRYTDVSICFPIYLFLHVCMLYYPFLYITEYYLIVDIYLVRRAKESVARGCKGWALSPYISALAQEAGEVLSCLIQAAIATVSKSSWRMRIENTCGGQDLALQWPLKAQPQPTEGLGAGASTAGHGRGRASCS